MKTRSGQGMGSLVATSSACQALKLSCWR